MIIGVDCDGVLADFTYGYKNKLFEVSGVRRIGLNEDPTMWYWAQGQAGYTPAEDSAAWASIKTDPMFWATLPPYANTRRVLNELDELMLAGHEVYYITHRMGVAPHLQTRAWLEQNGAVAGPQVLIVRDHVFPGGKEPANKGHLAKGLGLTHLIDDKPENCLDVKAASPLCDVYLLEQPWNEKQRPQCKDAGIRITPSFSYFFQDLREYANA